MKIGYIRVSTMEQNTARQEILMDKYGIPQKAIYIEKVSGKDTNRPQLQAMLKFIDEFNNVQEKMKEQSESYQKEELTLIVESISRFARNTRDLLELVETLKQKNVNFISQKDAIDTTTASGKFMLTVFGAVAELERDYILQRQREGIEIAKQEGKYKGRKKIEVDKNFETVYKKWKSEEITATKAMEILELKRNTFYRRVKEYEEGK
jgi:DNA invertase Pin-like site-specific DNA recombinase